MNPSGTKKKKKTQEAIWLAEEELASQKYLSCTQLVDVTDDDIDDFMKAETRRCTSKYSPCPKSSETDGLEMSTEYVHSGAMDMLRNMFLQYNQQDVPVSQIIYSCKTLYMFRTVFPTSGAQKTAHMATDIRQTASATCC